MINKEAFELIEIPFEEPANYLENCLLSTLKALKEQCKDTAYCDEGCALVTEDGYCGLKLMVSGKRPCEYDFSELEERQCVERI